MPRVSPPLACSHASPKTDCSTPLDATETNPQRLDHAPNVASADSTPPDVGFRHSGWTRDRSRVLAGLQRVCSGSRRVERFGDCGRGAWIYADSNDPNRYAIRGSHCHDRFCVPCARSHAREVAAVLELHCHNRRCLFVTLTLRSTDQPLADQIDRLYHAFAALRRRDLWTGAVRGGGAVLEITYNHGRHQWHPHLHVIAEGSWLPVQELRTAWHQVTGDSFVVDVRLASTASDVAAYVCKYLGKPISHSVLGQADVLDEALVALTGRRTFMTFGTWHGKKMRLPIDSTVWHAVAPLAEVLVDAANGLDYALRIIRLLKEPSLCSKAVTLPP